MNLSAGILKKKVYKKRENVYSLFFCEVLLYNREAVKAPFDEGAFIG